MMMGRDTPPLPKNLPKQEAAGPQNGKNPVDKVKYGLPAGAVRQPLGTAGICCSRDLNRTVFCMRVVGVA